MVFYCSDRLISPKNINSGSHSPKNVFFGRFFGKGEKYETVKNQRPLHKKETQKVWRGCSYLSLFFGRPIQSEYQFCHFTFTPNTPTGKAAKYPYTMFFNCKNGNITFTGKIEYLSNNTMGKISITIFDSKNTFEIAVAVKNSSLQITRIGQAIFNKQYMTDIFNINKQ